MISKYRLEAQIKAINKQVKEGKVKNIYAANNKVKGLQKQLAEVARKETLFNYLAK